MAAARYWRIVGIEAYSGGDLELSEIALYSGASRIDGAATLTSSHAPVAGALVDLKDGSTSTACRFAAADVRSAGFYLQWDFGSAVDIAEIKFGAASSAARFLAAGTLMQGAGAGDWSYAANFSGVVYPGTGEMTASAGGFSPTTWNPSDKGSGAALSNANLTVAGDQGTGWARSLFGALAGKFYWEISSTGVRYPVVGVAKKTAVLGANFMEDINSWGFYGPAPYKGYNKTYTAYGQKWNSPSQVVGFALDMDAGTLELFMNGVSMGLMYSGIFGEIYAVTEGDTNANTSNTTANFGASAFAYAPPAGYVAGFGAQALKIPVTATPKPYALRTGFGVAASAPVPAHSIERMRASIARDVEHGGPGTIYGTTKTKGTPNLPTKARVVLQHQRSKLPVRETWSDPVTGAFVFSGIDTSQQFLALAEDAAGNFHPVAANRLTPEVLP